MKFGGTQTLRPEHCPRSHKQDSMWNLVSLASFWQQNPSALGQEEEGALLILAGKTESRFTHRHLPLPLGRSRGDCPLSFPPSPPQPARVHWGLAIVCHFLPPLLFKATLALGATCMQHGGRQGAAGWAQRLLGRPCTPPFPLNGPLPGVHPLKTPGGAEVWLLLTK